MISQTKLHSVDDWLALPDDGKRYELIQGELIEMPSSSKINAILASWIAHQLWAYILPRNLGYVTGPDGGYQINAVNAFQPDVGFITKDRVGDPLAVTFPVAPDIAVEIISPSESARDVLDKARTYLKAGTYFVWAIYPKDKVVDIFRLAENGSLNVQTIGADGLLTGENVLPDFTLKLDELFALLGTKD